MSADLLQHNSICSVAIKSLSPYIFVLPVLYSTWSNILSGWFLALVELYAGLVLTFANTF
jgi:hypothetical protein